MADHDKTHKLFFSHRRLVHDFFLGYLPREWTERMDFSTLESVNANLIGKDLSARHGDQIWRIRWQVETQGGQEDSWFYFYLLLEFQSSPSPYMALRLHNYVGHLLEDLVRQPRLVPGRRLPPVVPLVLYDGTRPWTPPLDLASLFVPVPESVRRHLPQLHPLFLDESRIGQETANPDNLATLFFQVNTSRSLEALPDLATAISVRLPADGEPELREDFAHLLLRILRQAFPGVTIPEVTALEEIPMVGQHLIAALREGRHAAELQGREQGWREGRQEGEREGRQVGKREGLQEGKREGRQEGKREGRQIGEVEGMRRILLDQLKLRFGAVSLPVRQRVKTIESAAELRALARKVLIASSLEEMGLA
jgi:predicted transposase YdaD